MNRSAFTKVTEYFYIDDSGKVYFSVEEFLRVNDFPDTPKLRYVVIQDIRSLMPGILILEECIETDPEAEN